MLVVFRFRHARLPNMRNLPIGLPKSRLTRTLVEPVSLNVAPSLTPWPFDVAPTI